MSIEEALESDEQPIIEEDDPPLIPGYQNLSDYINEGYKVLTDGVKASSSLPSGRNYSFYENFTNFKEEMGECTLQLQTLMENILKVDGMKRRIKDCTLEDAMDAMQDINDATLDRSRQTMDYMDGIRGNALLANEVASRCVSGSWNKATAPKGTDTLTKSRHQPRPQFTFSDKIDNSNKPWEPKIKEKPNALTPLSIVPEFSEDGILSWSHPYENELEALVTPDNLLKKGTPRRPKPLTDTPLVMVTSIEKLNNMINDLTGQEIIAIDLEHHSLRSFMGFTCLIQISTFETDYVIDALALRNDLHVLNGVFTNPAVLKIMHGADFDIGWLQRDFGVYVVNLFDTHQAAKLLSFPKLSLAFLLAHFCKVIAAKRYQLYDWRTRPLPDGAIQYAREDTHYLLYIYQCMANQLIDAADGKTNLIQACFARSTDICRTKYSKPQIHEDSYMVLYRKSKRMFDNRQLHALKGLYLWRDKTAREQDESLSFVLSDHMMLQIAETLPREAQGILACCNPIPPLVKTHILELHYIVTSAKEQPLVKVIPECNPVPIDSVSMALRATMELKELRDEWVFQGCGYDKASLPTLLDGSLRMPSDTEEEESEHPTLSIFSDEGTKLSDDGSSKHIDDEVRERLSGLHFVSPYQRYLKVLPYAVQLEQERLAWEEAEAKRLREEAALRQNQGSLIKAMEDSGVIKLKKEREDQTPLSMKVRNFNRLERERTKQSVKRGSSSESSSNDSPAYKDPKKRSKKSETAESTQLSVPQPMIVKSENNLDNNSSSGSSGAESSEDEEPEMPLPIPIKKEEKDDSRKRKSSETVDGNSPMPSKIPKEGPTEKFDPDKSPPQRPETLGKPYELLNKFSENSKGRNHKNDQQSSFEEKEKSNNTTFQPFDYSKVDFNKFSSHLNTKKDSKKKQNQDRHAKKGKNKIVSPFGNKRNTNKKKGRKW